MHERLIRIKLMLMDVDGVLTDGRFFYSDDGSEFKAFDVKDGFAIRLAMVAGLKFGIITGKMSPIVERRARELGIEEVHQGFFNKVEVYEGIKRRGRYEDEERAYIGDDLFDLGVMARVGLAAAPADAVDEIKNIAHYITKAKGGRGAVRELIEMILRASNLWDKYIDDFIAGKLISQKV